MNDEGKFYHKSEDESKITWVNDEKQATTVVSNKDGEAIFEGLALGSYTVRETHAADGFRKLTEDIYLDLNKSGNGYEHISVYNQSGIRLPGTGGEGSGLFAVIGGVIVILTRFSLMKIKNRRNSDKSKEN